ncbi:MAG: MSMEG_4193 family putative phosphomutase [Acidimicrobiales bacterium]
MPRRAAPPAPTTVLFVRHGQTPTTGRVLPGRAAGLHLSETGREQARAVAERVAALPRVDAIYASPLERTRETAAPIATARKLRVRIERGLLECDFGDWTGGELKQLMKLPEWRVVQGWPSGFRFPGGESFAEMQTRITTAVSRLRAAHPGGTIVAVSHADPIKAVAADALGTHLDHFQRIVISPCSVTAISYGVGGPVVLGLNSGADLGSAPSPRPPGEPAKGAGGPGAGGPGAGGPGAGGPGAPAPGGRRR